MTYFWQLFFTVIIAFSLNFGTPAADSSPISTTQTTANEFFRLGVEKMQNGNDQEAIANFNQAIQLQENFAAAYSDRCLAYLQLQEYHQAIVDCTQAINLTPDNVEAYLNRGLAQYRQGNYPDAIADDERAIVLQPSDFRAYYNRGLALAAQENYTEAIIDYNNALKHIPQDNSIIFADIYNDRGLARLQLQDLKAAMLDFDMAISLNSNDYRAYFNRGCACGRNGDDFGALRDFSEVIRLKPSYALAYLNRGVARHRLGYHEGAIADLQKASQYFEYKGEKLAYQKALDLLKTMQQAIPSTTEVA
jgi:tetratricopeptide (TPR) repeat protein